MKELRKTFKRLVKILRDKNVVSRLEKPSIDETRQAWKNVVSETKSLVNAWKDKNYEGIRSNWIYPMGRNIEPTDYPIEICILIKLLNLDSNKEKEITDRQIVYESDQLIKALDKVSEESDSSVSLGIADALYNGDHIYDMDIEEFLELFVS